MAEKRSFSGGDNSPGRSQPQQTALPSSLSAQVWALPLLMAEKRSFWGGDATFPAAVPAPADSTPVFPECTGVGVAAADGGETLTLRRRCLTVFVVPPADGGPIFRERTGVPGAAADGDEAPTLRGR